MDGCHFIKTFYKSRGKNWSKWPFSSYSQTLFSQQLGKTFYIGNSKFVMSISKMSNIKRKPRHRSIIRHFDCKGVEDKHRNLYIFGHHIFQIDLRHRLQLPPQSMPVSSQLRIPSKHVAARILIVLSNTLYSDLFSCIV